MSEPAAATPIPRALLAGLPSRAEALKQQLTVLRRFHTENKAAFDEMPYEAWTVPPKGYDGLDERQFEQRPAAPPLSGLRGVYLRKGCTVPAKSTARQLLYYSGLLVTSALFKLFVEQYFCPTALELPALAYTNKKGAKVIMLVIGDPTSLGALINDGKFGRDGTNSRTHADAVLHSRVRCSLPSLLRCSVSSDDEEACNCQLLSVKEAHLSRVLTPSPLANGKKRVSTEVAAVWTIPDEPIAAGQELLLDYGESFWAGEKAEADVEVVEHCALCFSRAVTVDNPLILCDGFCVGKQGGRLHCPVARHRECMNNILSLEEIHNPNVSFRCPNHMLQQLPKGNLQRQPATPVTHRKPRVEITLTPDSPPLRANARALPSAAASAVPASMAGAAQPATPAVARNLKRRIEIELTPDPPPNLTVRLAPRSITHAPGNPTSLRVKEPMDICLDTPAAAAASNPPMHPSPAQRFLQFGSQASNLSDSSSSPMFYSSSGIAVNLVDIDDEERCASEYQASEPSQAESSSEGDNEHSSDSDSDVRDRGPRAMGKRVAPPSVAQSRLEEQLSDVQSLKLNFAMMEDQSARPPISLRQTSDAVKNAQFAAIPDINDAQWQAMMNELEKHIRPGKPKPWFITNSLVKAYRKRIAANAPKTASKKGKGIKAVAPAAAPALVIRSSSVISSAAGDHNESDGASLASTNSGKATTNRWRERKDVEHDWKEYGTCCGDKDHWTEEHEASEPGGKARRLLFHPALNIKNFWSARLNHRALYNDKKSYDTAVAAEFAALSLPRWGGYTVCKSCFRAVLGCSRNKVFAHAKVNILGIKPQDPLMTQAGARRTKRQRKKLALAICLLRKHVKAQGQHRPNPKNSHMNRKVVRIPQTTVAELHQALLLTRVGKDVNFSQSTTARAKAELEVVKKLMVQLGTGGSLLRCEHCDSFDNQQTPQYLALHRTSPEELNTLQQNKISHLQTMQEQRDCFDRHKVNAMENPLDEFTVTLDGMDQAKTQLPSRKRDSKATDAVAQLKMHWTGAFCFGGQVPVLGLSNTPELRKDSALSCVSVLRILLEQWSGILELYPDSKEDVIDMTVPANGVAPMEMSDDADSVAPAAAAAAAAAHAPAASAAAAAHDIDASTDAAPPPYSGPGDHWPARLHITFDNAQGECKNQWMMRFLGLLVHHGMFEAITISMLLVGHTHDIVDQMFSVWARALKLNDAVTYEAMRDLFRERYHTRIDALVELIRQRVKDRNDKLNHSESVSVDDELDGDSMLWDEEAVDVMEDWKQVIGKLADFQPYIGEQEVTIDIQGWLEQAVVNGVLPPINNLAASYNYGIEKDPKDGGVYLYNRQFDKSTEDLTGTGQIHHYLNQLTGDYTTRAILYKKADPGLNVDPYRVPSLRIDTAPLRKTAATFVENNAMSVEQQAE